MKKGSRTLRLALLPMGLLLLDVPSWAPAPASSTDRWFIVKTSFPLSRTLKVAMTRTMNTPPARDPRGVALTHNGARYPEGGKWCG